MVSSRMISWGGSIEGVDGVEEIFDAALTNFRFFFFASPFLLIVELQGTLRCEHRIGLGTVERGVTMIGFPYYWISLGVSKVGSRMPSIGTASVEGFIPIWAVSCGLKMVTEDK